MELSKEFMQEELTAIDDSIKAHTDQKEIHELMIKKEGFLKTLVEAELEKFK